MSAGKKLPPLTDHLEYWLRTASNHASYVLGQRLSAEGVTTAEWSLLRELYDVESISPTHLAKRLALTGSAITKLVDRLMPKGLVVREFNASGARTQCLYLTEAGRALVPALAAHAATNEAKLFDRLSAEERRVLQKVLMQIVEWRQDRAEIPAEDDTPPAAPAVAPERNAIIP